MLKDLVAEREALKNECIFFLNFLFVLCCFKFNLLDIIQVNKFENLESTMEIEGDLNLTFKGEQEEISLKVKFLK